jgi:hypothetical protein
MTQLRRLALLALALGALLTGSVRAAELDPYLPNDSEGMLFVNVKQLLDSPVFQKFAKDTIKEALKDNDKVQKLLKDLEFDPMKDLDRLIVTGSAGDGERGLMILRGRFDRAKFEAKAEEAAKEKGAILKIHKVPNGAGGQYTLYEVTKTPGLAGPKIALQNKPGYMALLDKDVIVFSSAKDMVIDALDKSAGRKKTEVKSADFKRIVEKSSGKQGVWVAALPTLIRKLVPGADDDAIKEYLDKVDGISGGITVEDDVKIEFAVAAKNPKDAKELSDTVSEAVNQMVGVVSLLAGQQKQLVPVIDILKTVRASDKDKIVIIKAMITTEVIEKAQKGAPKK